jgi:hypothetical protein
MNFEMLDVFEHKPLRLTRGMMTLYPGFWVSALEVSPFNVVHHRRRPTKGAHPLFVALRFVANAERALGLATDEGENRFNGPDLGRILFGNRWSGMGDAKSVS